MLDVQLPGAWKNGNESFTAANTTLAKILLDVTPAVVGAAVSGEVPVGGESLVRQRVFTGGQRVIGGSISSTDGTAREAIIYFGKQMSLFANMGTVTTSGTNALNRSTGSFINDGFKVGDTVMFFGAASAANNGLLLQVTAVTATVLTFNGTAITNETEAAGFRVFKVTQRTHRTVPINAGNTGAIPAVQLIGGTQDPSAFPAPDTGWSLDADNALIVAMTATVSALPARVDFQAESTLY